MKGNLVEISKQINEVINGEVIIHDTSFGFSINYRDRYMSLFLPFKIGKVEVRKNNLLKFGENNICYFEINGMVDLASIIELSIDWLKGRLSLSEIQLKFPKIKMEAGVNFLEEGISAYIDWKWKSLVESKLNPIDLRGYKAIYDILYDSEISKLFPYFHGHEGLTVINYINKRIIEYPYIQKSDNNNYLIVDSNASICLECTIENVYEEYRKFFPKEINLAAYYP